MFDQVTPLTRKRRYPKRKYTVRAPGVRTRTYACVIRARRWANNVAAQKRVTASLTNRATGRVYLIRPVAEIPARAQVAM